MNEENGAGNPAPQAKDGAAPGLRAPNDEDRLFPEKARAELVATVGKAILRLRGPTLAPEDVHRARRLLKRANALALMTAETAGPRAERAAEDLRHFRRELSATRDLDVIGQMIDSLAPDLDATDPKALRAALEERRRAAESEAVAPDPGALRRELRWLAGEAARWSLGHGLSRDLAAALTRSYKKARRRGEDAFASGEAADLHALRKAIIVHREQLQALDDVWPRLVHAWCAEAQGLRDALGRVNDLALFADFLDRAAPETADALKPMIEQEKRRALHRAEPAFRRLFFERPGEAERRFTAWLAHPKRLPDLAAEDGEGEADAAA